MSLRETVSSRWRVIQGDLFPWLEEAHGFLTPRHRQLVMVLDIAEIEALVPGRYGGSGRPLSERGALARAFVAKAVFNLGTTGALLERLTVDRTLRRLCGWARASAVPSAATFSRAFGEFAASALPSRLHEALISATHTDRLVGHISRDSTAIEVREKALPPPRKIKTPKRGPGHPKPAQGEAKQARRVARQSGMDLTAMLADLPRHCTTGAKCNAKGHNQTWIGYKLHMDMADGGIPISCVLTAASLHDSQVAIPLATMTAQRVTSLYDLMDSAYDVPEIKAHSRSLGHVPIIATHPRKTPGRKAELKAEAKRRRRVGHLTAEDSRFNERSTAERANGRIKDEFGGRTIRVRGHDKVLCHLMFGVLALTVDQLIRLVT